MFLDTLHDKISYVLVSLPTVYIILIKYEYVKQFYSYFMIAKERLL
nr:MAG TPA: hypothetical protein [Caudoviricetes sp.]